MPARAQHRALKAFFAVFALFWMLGFGLGGLSLARPSGRPPAINTLLKPAIYKKVVEEREAMTYATLEENRYSYYAVMLVRAGEKLTRQLLTDYQLYAKMISYIDRAEYSAETRILKVEGGIWNFKLSSEILFEEYGDRWIRYRIVRGHFAGLTGDLFFEPMGEKGTLVYMRGEKTGTQWPAKFVIERGAEIVFGFTANKMRSFIESQKFPRGGTPNSGVFQGGNKNHDEQNQRHGEVPAPRSGL